MPDLTLTERLSQLRQKYIDSAAVITCPGTCDDPRKAKKLKKKLLALEKERCQALIEHKDISAINQKIAHLKEHYLKQYPSDNHQ